MSRFAHVKPDLRVTFNAADATLMTAYPWTDANDVRPSGNPQFVTDGNAGTITGNKLANVSAQAARCGVMLPSAARKIQVNLDNNEVTSNSESGVLLRGSAGLAQFLTASIRRIQTGPAYNLYVKDELGNVIGSALSITPAPGVSTEQPFVVTDDGAVVQIQYAGNILIVPTSLYVGNAYCGPAFVLSPAATGTLTLDNLTAWI